MLGASLLTICAVAISFACCTYIEGVSANVDSTSVDKKHEKFVPLVAFECGFRNKYMGEDGNWITDRDRYATCMKGKLDILKYCRKVYPNLDITNIVEYSHEVKIPGWCKEEGSPCKWFHTVRPYHCIVGEFRSEALQVPHGCKFGHVSEQQSCKSYQDWEKEATKQCEAKTSLEGNKMTVRSFAILEPCGLDLFTGVEYVCCPADKESTPKVVDLDESKVDDDEDDVDDDDFDYSEEDEDDEEDDKDTSQDAYFKNSDPANEHERFKNAEQRLEKKHRAKVDKVMREWSELDERYKKMKENDAKGAEAFKSEMTSRFQKTVASLEEENKDQKKEMEDKHEERVQLNLNEKKRTATHNYRQALAIQVEKPNKHNVLKSLKAYIRAEEKDRTHILNRYRHLLRRDPAEAEKYRPILMHRLHYIDMRINSTLAMLHDFPDLERQVRPIAVEFWSEYRDENTPEVTEEQYTAIGGEEQYAKLLDHYKDLYVGDRDPAVVKTTTVKTTTTTTTAAPKAEAKDSSEDDDEDDMEDDDDEESPAEKNKDVAVEKVEQRVPPAVAAAKSTKDEQTQTNDESNEDDDDDDEDDISDDKSVEREINVEIEPIVSEPARVHDLPPLPAYARHDSLEHKKESPRSWASARFVSSSQLLIVFVVSAVVIAFVITMSRRRRRHAGFIEVDVCTPEERHVNGMQVNGYENPTYTFFDGKP